MRARVQQRAGISSGPAWFVTRRQPASVQPPHAGVGEAALFLAARRSLFDVVPDQTAGECVVRRLKHLGGVDEQRGLAVHDDQCETVLRGNCTFDGCVFAGFQSAVAPDTLGFG